MSARLALVFVIVAAAARLAVAQPADLAKVQALYTEAQGAYNARNFDAAAEGFKKVYEARPEAQFLYNTAAAYHMKGKTASDVPAYELAVQYYQKYLTALPPTPPAPSRARRRRRPRWRRSATPPRAAWW